MLKGCQVYLDVCIGGFNNKTSEVSFVKREWIGVLLERWEEKQGRPGGFSQKGPPSSSSPHRKQRRGEGSSAAAHPGRPGHGAARV
jgi:hypothetical protein